jgi:hypothetical protein
MEREHSVNRLTAEIIEACIDRSSSESAASESEILESDTWAEHQKFREAVMNSPRLRGEVVVTAAALRSEEFSPDNPPSTEAALALYRKGTLTEWHIELVLSACREWFFYGWHGRGALDEAGTLSHLYEGRDRRRR